MKRLNILLMLLSLMVGGCKDGNRSSNESDTFFIVDVKNSYPSKELILQDFMDVEYIPLETSEEFLTSAHIQAITKDFILLKENNRVSSGKISFFDRNGKGLRAFDRKGQSGEEYTNALGVVVDDENNEIFVNSHLSSKILVYDLSGNFKRSFNHKENAFYNQMEEFDQGHLICHDGSFSLVKPEEKKNCFMIVSKEDGSIKEISIPYKEKKLTVLAKKTDTGNMIYSIYNKKQIPYQDSWLLMEPSADTIYRYSQDQTMKPFIVRSPSVQLMDPEVFLYPGVLSDRYYFMQTVKNEFDFEKGTGFSVTELVYDRQEGAIFECLVFNGDFIRKIPMSLVYQVPIAPIIINNDEIAFLTRLEAPDLMEAYGAGKLRGKLKEIAAGLDEESNPVIMLAKYKK